MIHASVQVTTPPQSSRNLARGCPLAFIKACSISCRTRPPTSLPAPAITIRLLPCDQYPSTGLPLNRNTLAPGTMNQETAESSPERPEQDSVMLHQRA